jgi:Arc/MetJ-type ribon-helix-helix transcriptional regulator
MVRTQIQLTEEQHARLRELARATGQSMAELIRGGVDLVLEGARESPRREARRRALEVIGKFESGLGDLAERHDDYLVEAFES